MTLDRKDYKSAIPQLEKRIAQVEKIGKEVQNKFDDIAHQTQLDAAEAEKKVAALDYQIDSINVVTEYQLQTNGQDPVEANWSTTMPSITYQSYNGKTLWARSVTYQNDVAIRKTAPQKVELMDGLYTFVNSASGNAGWTMIDGDFIQTGKIASTNGYSYFDIDNNSFQMKDGYDVEHSNSVLAWQNGLLYVKGKIAVGASSTDQKYYTEMTGGGFEIVANDVTLAHLGYASGAGEGGTATAPYYTFGTRASDTPSTRGNYSVAEGVDTTASGYASHAEGSGTLASGYRSHAEGSSVTENSVTKPATASGNASHAEGMGTTASGNASHAEGMGTTASGNYSHAGGTRTEAQGDSSVAYGYGTIAGKPMQVAIGTFNAIDPGDNPDAVYGDGKYLFIIGNGRNSTTGRHNAFTVDWNGNIKAGGLDCGVVSITPTAGSVTSKKVTFNHTFSSPPYVVATAESAYPNAVSEVTVSNVTTTGFTMNLLRTTNVATNIFWIAML